MKERESWPQKNTHTTEKLLNFICTFPCACFVFWFVPSAKFFTQYFLLFSLSVLLSLHCTFSTSNIIRVSLHISTWYLEILFLHYGHTHTYAFKHILARLAHWHGSRHILIHFQHVHVRQVCSHSFIPRIASLSVSFSLYSYSKSKKTIKI